MHRLYFVFAACIILLGIVHTSATAVLFDRLNNRALWFASAGLLLILTGTLNLLNRSYGSVAGGLKLATIGTNAVMTAFAALAGIVGAASGGQLILIVGLMAATALVSLVPRALSG